MTLRNFPPADQCDPEDLNNLADLVVRDPRASYDLAGSREHIEALCRWAVRQVQDLSDLRETHGTIADAQRALQQGIYRLTEERDRLAQHLSEAHEERDDLKVRNLDYFAARARLNDLAEDLLVDLDSARTEIRALQSTLDHERNERQGEVLRAEADRERADAGEAAAEVFEATARAALAILARDRGAQPIAPVSLEEIVRAVDGRLSRALVRMVTHDAMQSVRLENALRRLDEQQQTLHHNDRIQSALASTGEAVTGKTIEQVNLELDEELAANPDLGPLHHARDMREGDTTP